MSKADALDCLRATIEIAAAPLKPDPLSLSALLSKSKYRILSKGDHLCRQGEPVNELIFVYRGLLRYYLLADGVEHTGQFFDDGMFVVDVAALSRGERASQSIDALEPSEAITIPRTALLAAYDACHAFERFGRRGVEEAMAGSQRRTANLLQLTSEQRYERFVETRPEVALRIPLYITASYLGITPEALSRLRRRRTQR